MYLNCFRFFMQINTQTKRIDLLSINDSLNSVSSSCSTTELLVSWRRHADIQKKDGPRARAGCIVRRKKHSKTRKHLSETDSNRNTSQTGPQRGDSAETCRPAFHAKLLLSALSTQMTPVLQHPLALLAHVRNDPALPRLAATARRFAGRSTRAAPRF